MRTVRDSTGTEYVLLKESGESSLVRNPRTGEQHHIPNADLESVSGKPPLATAARAVPEATRRVLTAAPDDRGLGLLVELDARGPLSVRNLLAGTELCESDLLGLLTEFRAAGLVAETRIGGERGYDLTEMAAAGLARLRDDPE